MMKNKLLPRILLTLLGVALIFMAAAEAVLGFAGESAPGVITHVRREGGERQEAVANRYTYDISYTFTLPDGEKIDGSAKKVGDAVFVKTDGNSPTTVRYLPFCPQINTLEGRARLGLEQIVMLLVGAFLIYFINKKQKPRED